MAALCCFAFFFWHSPTRLYTDKRYNSHANQITQTYYHIGVKLGVHASQHYNSHMNQITQTYYHIGVKLEVHASHRYSRIVPALDMPTWKEIRRNTLSKLRQEYT